LNYHFDLVPPPRSQQSPSAPPLDSPAETESSERDLLSGKVPLRPIQRAGFLVSGLFFVGVFCWVVGVLISAGKGGSLFIKCLLSVLGLGWYLLFFPLGRRMIWSALRAPSERDSEEEDSEEDTDIPWQEAGASTNMLSSPESQDEDDEEGGIAQHN